MPDLPALELGLQHGLRLGPARALRIRPPAGLRRHPGVPLGHRRAPPPLLRLRPRRRQLGLAPGESVIK